MLRKLLSVFAALVFIAVPAAAAAQVFGQNQIILPPFGSNGFVVSTTTGGSAKLSATSTPFFSNFFATVGNITRLGNLTSNGLVKTSGGNGALSIATNGTDYTLITGTTCSVGDFVSAVAANGTVTCSTPSASGSSGLGTTSPWSIGNLAYVTSDSAVTSVATGTLTTTATGLQFNNTRFLVGGAAVLSLSDGYNIPLTASTTNWNGFYDDPSTRITAGTGISWSSLTLNCDIADTNTTGCLTDTDWDTFNGKENVLTFNSPFSRSGNTISWTGLATTSQPSSSNLLVSNGGAGVYGVATSSAACTSASGITCTGFSIVGSGGTTLALSSIPNSSLANSTISGISLGSNLANLTATDSTLTFSGTYNGGTARTIGVNLANPNTWSALQIFSSASSTLFSNIGTAYFGGTATSTFDSTGKLTLANAAEKLRLPNLGTAAGAFLAVDPDGDVIATSTPSGGSSKVASSTTFTASGTWVRPSDVTKVRVIVVGGGGGGGGANKGDSTDWVGGGGGGGACAFANVTVSGNVTVTVGGAGSGATTGGSSATAGGNSSFAGAVTVTANGGGAGNNGAPTGGSGGGGTATNAQWSQPGEDGFTDGSFTGTGRNSGKGGNSCMGYGGKPARGQSDGNAAGGYGGGGGGGYDASNNGSAAGGGAGTAGIVIVQYETAQ